MKTREKVLIYIFLCSVIVVCSIFLYKIIHKEKTLYNEIYAESNEILKNINNITNDSVNNFVQNQLKNTSISNNTNLASASSSSNNKSERLTTERINSFLRITKLDIFSPIIEKTTMDNLKVAPTKLWGGEPNSIGNYCIIGHNLENNEQFSKLKELTIGDVAELMDKNGYTVEYEVYKVYTVDDNDLSFTTQKTDGKRELTLVTCTNKSNKRLIVRCKEI
ncbi:MAG: sortase [Clostridia bacterium]|nr:sortase [Clostridia bacterium]